MLHGVKALSGVGVDVTLGVLAESRAPNHANRFASAARALGVSNVREYPCAGRVDFGLVRALANDGLREGWDILHCHGYKPLSYAFLAVRLVPHQPALVATHHGETAHSATVSAYERLALALYGMTDRVVAVSSIVEGELRQRGVKAVSRVDNLVSLAGADPCPSNGRLVTVGRLSSEKGIDVLLDALRRVGKGAPPLDIVGEGPERAALEAGAAGLDVRFHGWLEDATPVLRPAMALVQPSRREGLPVAVLEALACGVPVVASSVGGIPEVVSHGVTGLLAQPGDASALARALTQLSTLATGLRLQAAAGAPEIIDRYGPARWASETLALYSELLAGRRAPHTLRTRRPIWAALSRPD